MKRGSRSKDKKRGRSKSPNLKERKRGRSKSPALSALVQPKSNPGVTSGGGMDIPKPLAIILDELEAHLKEKSLMMCAAVFAWSFAVARNFGYKLV
jgi:hypothetical protein